MAHLKHTFKKPKKKKKKHRRVKSVEALSKQSLRIITDRGGGNNHLNTNTRPNRSKTAHFDFSPIGEDEIYSKPLPDDEEDDMDDNDFGLFLSEIDIIDSSSRSVPEPLSNFAQTPASMMTPLMVNKYSTFQLLSVIKNRKPELLESHNDLKPLNQIVNKNKQIDSLIYRLELCEVLCDFQVIDIDVSESQCIENKTHLLRECREWLSKNEWSSMSILKQLFRTIQTNLFRSLPDSCLIVEFHGIDQKDTYTLPSWCHLQVIYEILFQVFSGKGNNIDEDTLQSYIGGEFLINFVSLFHSVITNEVDYVKILIHSMYSDLHALRDEIRICLSQYCWDYIYSQSHCNYNGNNGNSHRTGAIAHTQSVKSILEILSSIISGLRSETMIDSKWFVVFCHVLCPLLKCDEFMEYSNVLYQSFSCFMTAMPYLFKCVFNNGFIKFWPKTNPLKEKCFIKQCMNVLILCCYNKKHDQVYGDGDDPELNMKCIECVIEKFRLCLFSQHYKIIDECIECLNNRKLRKIIKENCKETIWIKIYKSLLFVKLNHFLYLTRNKSNDCMTKFKLRFRETKQFKLQYQAFDDNPPQSFDDLFIDFQRNLNNKNRIQKWQKMHEIAQKNKIKLVNVNKIRKNSNFNAKMAELAGSFDSIKTTVDLNVKDLSDFGAQVALDLSDINPNRKLTLPDDDDDDGDGGVVLLPESPQLNDDDVSTIRSITITSIDDMDLKETIVNNKMEIEPETDDCNDNKTNEMKVDIRQNDSDNKRNEKRQRTPTRKLPKMPASKSKKQVSFEETVGAVVNDYNDNDDDVKMNDELSRFGFRDMSNHSLDDCPLASPIPLKMSATTPTASTRSDSLEKNIYNHNSNNNGNDNAKIRNKKSRSGSVNYWSLKNIKAPSELVAKTNLSDKKFINEK